MILSTAAIFVAAFNSHQAPPKVSSPAVSNLRAEFPGGEKAQVSRVVDGDTIEVDLNGVKEKVRYIGMNTPESVDPRRAVQCFGKEASAANAALVENKEVRLVRDVSDRDKYGRLLRYVYLNDDRRTFVDLELVRQGYATIMTYPPDIAHVTEFRTAERAAREAGRGLWSACR